MSATTRLATPADAPRVVALLVAQLREHDIPTPRDHVARMVALVTSDPTRGFVLIAELEGAACGVAYVSFAAPLEHAGVVAWLEELYVAPAQRNQGVGKKLVEDVAARAEGRGCVSVDLEVEAGHARAGHLYARQGYRRMTRTHWVLPLSRWDW
jgi:GNAT superfamily N-acetyltransferase